MASCWDTQKTSTSTILEQGFTFAFVFSKLPPSLSYHLGLLSGPPQKKKSRKYFHLFKVFSAGLKKQSDHTDCVSYRVMFVFKYFTIFLQSQRVIFLSSVTLINSMLPLRKVSKPYIVLYWKICRNWILKAPNLKTFFITSTNFVSGKWSPGKICVFEQNLGHYTPFTGDPWWVNSPFCAVCFQAVCWMVLWFGVAWKVEAKKMTWNDGDDNQTMQQWHCWPVHVSLSHFFHITVK